MGRIALFVLVVGGVGWWAVDPLARAAGWAPDPLARASVAVIIAVILWTVLVWRFADHQASGGAREPEDTDERR